MDAIQEIESRRFDEDQQIKKIKRITKTNDKIEVTEEVYEEIIILSKFKNINTDEVIKKLLNM